ncbi:unnamed protein product, partial [Protopolystoma xenopodis]
AAQPKQTSLAPPILFAISVSKNSASCESTQSCAETGIPATSFNLQSQPSVSSHQATSTSLERRHSIELGSLALPHRSLDDTFSPSLSSSSSSEPLIQPEVQMMTAPQESYSNTRSANCHGLLISPSELEHINKYCNPLTNSIPQVHVLPSTFPVTLTKIPITNAAAAETTRSNELTAPAVSPASEGRAYSVRNLELSNIFLSDHCRLNELYLNLMFLQLTLK